MKRTDFTLDLSKFRKIMQSAGIFGRMYITLALCTFVVFLLIGAVGYGQSKTNAPVASSMKGMAASLSNSFFLDMMGLEVPHLSGQKDAASAFSQENVLGFVLRMVTDISLQDPLTLLVREVPGLGLDSSYLLRKPGGGEAIAGPLEYPPVNPNGAGASGDYEPAAASSATPTPASTPEPTPATLNTNNKEVLIYHSHNRESWVPELGLADKDANLAQDSTVNITLVGKELADRLEEKGIGALHYATDYASSVDNYNWYYSYKYSGKTVKEAFAAHPEIKFAFDLHRDDSSKEKSTLTVDGINYAKVFLIIGQKNPQWEQNEAFASQIQNKLEEKMPGLSRGIWAKDAHDGNAEYNQSLSTNSVLIEVGGVYNTLEECKRTAGVLADVIADLYWNAEKVNAPVAAN